LVDEVLAVGDIAFQQKCLDRIKAMQDRGTTIIFISHNVHAVLEVCPRVIVLERGAKLIDAEAREAVGTYLRRMPGRSANRTQRYEDSPIVIRKVAFVDRHGREQESFRSGDSVVVRILLEARVPVNRPVIGLAFYGSDGTCLYGHNCKIDQWDSGEVEGSVEYEVSYDGVHLQPGRYLVSVAVCDRTQLRDYAYEDRAYSFSIEGAIASGLGVVRWPHSWRRVPLDGHQAAAERLAQEK